MLNEVLESIMALLVRGKTRCQICGQIIKEDEPAVGFPAFLKKTHPLSRYSEGIFHQYCFDACPDKHAVEKTYVRFKEVWATRPKDFKDKEQIEAWEKSALAEFE